MKPRNPVVRELINNPNRNAGKHSTAKQKALSTATNKEIAMEVAEEFVFNPERHSSEFHAPKSIALADRFLVEQHDQLQHGKDLEDFDPITTTPINPATK